MGSSKVGPELVHNGLAVRVTVKRGYETNIEQTNRMSWLDWYP